MPLKDQVKNYAKKLVENRPGSSALSGMVRARKPLALMFRDQRELDERASVGPTKPMKTSDLTAAEITRLLDLEPNATCGFVRVTYIAKQEIAPGGLPQPFASGRPLGSALYFLVTPEAPVRLHRIRNDQLYHYYLGDPLEVFMLRGSGEVEHIVVGPDSSFLAIRSIPHVSSAPVAGS